MDGYSVIDVWTNYRSIPEETGPTTTFSNKNARLPQLSDEYKAGEIDSELSHKLKGLDDSKRPSMDSEILL